MPDKIDYSTRYKFLVSAGIALVLFPEALGVFIFTYNFSDPLTSLQKIIIGVLSAAMISGFILGLKWIRDGLHAWKAPEEENLKNLKLANKAQEVAIEIEKTKLNNTDTIQKRIDEIEKLCIGVSSNNSERLSIIEDSIGKNLIQYNQQTHTVISQCEIDDTPFDFIASSLMPGIADYIIEVIHIETEIENSIWVTKRIDEMENRRKTLFNKYKILAAWNLVLVVQEENFISSCKLTEAVKLKLPSASKIDVIPLNIYENYAPILHSKFV